MFQNVAEASLLKFKFPYKKAIFSLSLFNTWLKSFPSEIWLGTGSCPKPAGGIMKCCFWRVLEAAGWFPRPLWVPCWRCIFWGEKGSREGRKELKWCCEVFARDCLKLIVPDNTTYHKKTQKTETDKRP